MAEEISQNAESNPTPSPEPGSSGPGFLNKAADLAKKGVAMASKAKEGISKLAQASPDQFAENEKKRKQIEEEQQSSKDENPLIQLYNELLKSIFELNGAIFDPVRNIAGNLAQKGVDKIKSALSSDEEPENQESQVKNSEDNASLKQNADAKTSNQVKAEVSPGFSGKMEPVPDTKKSPEDSLKESNTASYDTKTQSKPPQPSGTDANIDYDNGMNNAMKG
ncbi:hypothetical protein [Legionella worsleiensis]|uniref:Uncharacterized protein n=1 Tax=Legionella worsleiensis TaxID=45076 RepID=A0A0W1AER9_9GAMM|nr:hypothetical protein [Legionella worsleiensis]KTD79833.1 hypothetical protein Lwor_1347 [Legionella worsleiensis]STY32344.1 Uncharacterised protein [Legionella worsleiensis]